jgi:phosphate transport system permease protein
VVTSVLLTPATRREAIRRALVKRDRSIAGTLLHVAIIFATLFTLLTLLTLLGRVFAQALPMFRERGTAFLNDTIGSEPAEIGIWPGLYGSFWIGVGVVVLTLPIGVAAAVYLEEYAKPHRITGIIRANIRNLAGVPAVIYGVLGLILFVKWLKPVTQGETVLAASFTLAVLVLPIIIITASEAISAVPQSLREAGYGVGATKWEVTRDHVLPYAAPGILTGMVLSLARALGEAAPLILVGAITGLLPATGLTERFTALPILIFNWSGRPSRPGPVNWENAAAAAALVLLVLCLIFNIGAVILRRRFERKRTGV